MPKSDLKRQPSQDHVEALAKRIYDEASALVGRSQPWDEISKELKSLHCKLARSLLTDPPAGLGRDPG